MIRKRTTSILTLAALLILIGSAGTAWARGRGESVPPVELSQSDGPYIEYSEDAFTKAEGKKRVLFFHATWCPNCRQADGDIRANLALIPADIVVFRTDYDSEKALKKQFGITRQHTFVYVNDTGEAISKWSGGGAQEIVSNVNG